MKKIKIKDIVLTALLTALYLIFYAISGGITFIIGPIGHAISPGICGFLSGAIILFISRKVGKFGQYTVLTAIIMLVFSLMGAGYLPWLISCMTAAFIADLIASRSNKTPVILVALASGIMHVGQAWGSIVPSWFFMESYRTTWINKGQTPESMDAMIKYTQGTMGIVSTIIVFALSFVGVLLGYLILRKHLKEGKYRIKENE